MGLKAENQVATRTQRLARASSFDDCGYALDGVVVASEKVTEYGAFAALAREAHGDQVLSERFHL
jgi:hypothetical protein